MIKQIKIRRANINDCNYLNKMFEKLLEYERKNYDKNIKKGVKINSFFNKKIDNNNYIILVCIIERELIGYISGYIDDDNKIKEDIEVCIESFYIEEKYRNKGIGTNLINEFIKYSKNLNIKYISIDNFVENSCAKYLYNKLGFKLLKENRRKEV